MLRTAQQIHARHYASCTALFAVTSLVAFLLDTWVVRLTYEAYSRGILNHYIIGTDAEINTDVPSNNDLMQWYFVAPPKFWGNFIIAYGGNLVFSMASAAGMLWHCT
jgi:hypothetical protein